MKKGRFILYCDRVIMACLCLLIFCLPFAKAGVEVFAGLAIFFWILKRVLGYRADTLQGMLPRTGLNKALGVFIAVNAVSMIFSVNFGLSLRGFIGKELEFMAIYFMLIEVINSKERLRSILMAIIASAILIVADAGVQYFKGIDFLKGNSLACLRASFSSRNGFAAWLIVMIPLFLGLLATGRVKSKRLKFLLLILIVLSSVCLILTYSRGAWVGFVIGILLMFYYSINNLSPKIRILWLSTIACLLATYLFLPQPTKVRIKYTILCSSKIIREINLRVKSILQLSEDPSILIRIRFWRESLKIIRDYPLIGCGLNTYSIVARDYKSFEGGGIYPHNSYLHMAAETGLLGLFAFLWVLFTFFQIGFKNLNQKKNPLVLGLLAGILAFLVHAFFDTHLYSLQLVVLFWFMLGLTVAVINIDRRMAV